MSDNFYVPPGGIRGNRFQVEGSQAKHIAVVLRHRPGDQLELFDGQGKRYRAVITSVKKHTVTGELTEGPVEDRESAVAVTVGCALLKKDRFEWLVEKATELGVVRIVPLLTQRTIVKPGPGRQEKKTARWNKVAREAAQQSQRSVLPCVEPPQLWPQVLKKAGQYDCTLVPCIAEKGRFIHQLGKDLESAGSVLILIGPEGGFSPEEIQQARDAGAHTVSLGKRRLRSETAALTAVVAVRENRRDF